MTVDEMNRKKQKTGYTDERIAELSGISLENVQKILNGELEDVDYSAMIALSRFLDEPMLIKEETVVYYAGKQQGEYTVEDYYALPDERRVELIDGYFYDMAAPTTYHQLIGAEVYRQIANYIMDQGGGCTPFISPVDVQLDNDDRTMVQPDVAVICDPQQITRRNILGVPDFVLEVISPSTKRKDCTLKLRKYENAGVREYWLADPYQKMVLAYFFEDAAACPAIYPIDADIPVRIYEGKLVLKFGRIAEIAKLC